MNRLFRCLACGALAAGCVTQARASQIVSTLGNDTPGFSDGDIVSALDLASAQAGQPAPFDAGNGNELFGPDFDQTWTHVYSGAMDIISATLQIGIHDSEGGSVGTATDGSGDEVLITDEQLNNFTVNGTSVRSLLLSDFEAAGQGENGQYEVYEISLPSSLFASLETGSAEINLSLMGPVFSPAALSFLPDLVNANNAASLVFSKLTIETQDDPVVPEPSTLAIWSILAAIGMVYVSRPGILDRLLKRDHGHN